MSALSFKIDKVKLDTQQKTILWNGDRIPIHGHMVCSGMSNRFMVYFVDRKYAFIPSIYMPHQRLVVKFVYFEEIHDYFYLADTKETIYGYYNTECPELNCITVNQPIRELCY
ncbi:hypothetical protein [Galbibacter pacificus]|uniref:Uncharacterized protein n=1 Tax=Galbibacter pacificus TaxID=2996052 RepID=A0ABT6FVW4_9FLAO|nr:hypothetical protein [Galbibacter pacificus]MDG3584149.1 hypothetical protein [Galbibacter pacificus]MDG3587418.1 hypothetical protein [Galbibacter pacificus]